MTHCCRERGPKVLEDPSWARPSRLFRCGLAHDPLRTLRRTGLVCEEVPALIGSSRTCVACGAEGQRCCPSSGGCSSGMECGTTGMCQPCGTAGRPCVAQPCNVNRLTCTGGGSVGAPVGAPCVRSGDCRTGLCVPEQLATGAATGHPGGYCSAVGRAPRRTAVDRFLFRSNCPPESVAVRPEWLANPAAVQVFTRVTLAGPSGGLPLRDGDVEAALCLAECRTEQDCRAGYTCDQGRTEDGGTLVNGACVTATP